jgi:hypothetical protein
MEGGTSHRKLDEFEKLIQDAIALLIKRGEISICRKKPLLEFTRPIVEAASEKMGRRAR